MRIGVLALQGAFREHIMLLEAAEVVAEPVRLPQQLDELDGLIIPGGESTAIAKLMETYGFYEAIPARCADGMALWGTCAGAILVASEIEDALPDQRPLGIIDMKIRRNAYGRQVDSFEAGIRMEGLGEGEFPGVFIRAPWIESVGEGVAKLAVHEGVVVAARQGRALATTFHPELTGDPAVHRYFVESVVDA